MLLVVTPIIKSMASDFIYSPNSRLTKLKRAIMKNTSYLAVGHRGYVTVILPTGIDNLYIGRMYYDNATNSATGFVLAVSEKEFRYEQELKSLFPTCIRLFCTNGFRYYRVDAVRIFHGNNTGRTKE